ncbi:hypothetical protein PVAG01_03804 [Phlyctema vagabunda]|uniref:Uncharacterized protein n=1 Tax=Phlyctema vagabunda TaxID=108571 RepID=A0ABR4PMR9_9HELO
MDDRYSIEDDTENHVEKQTLLRNTLAKIPVKQNHRSYLLLGCMIACLLLSAAVGIDIFIRHKNQNLYPFDLAAKYHCGNSAAEAKELGCTFELMTVSWMPPACHDDELNQEFRSVREWHFYDDLKGSREIGEAELSELTVMAYGTNEFHRMHCGYSWMKMHRALQRQGRIDKGLSYYKHTTHCADMYRPANMSAIGTDVTIGFGKC